MRKAIWMFNLVSWFLSVRYMSMGHVHRPISGTVQGIPFSIMRSVLYQAPAPRPAWDWRSFKPSQEASNIVANGDVTPQFQQFCDYATGT